MLNNIDNNVISITAGYYHTVALNSIGEVWAWGKNESGLLGSGSKTESYNPEQIICSGFSNIKAIAAGRSHSIALKEDSTVWTWGCNNLTPIQIKNFQNIQKITSGVSHSLALKDDGTVWDIDHDTNNDPVPIKVNNLNDVKDIVAGGWEYIAVKSNDSIWSWGWGANYYCQQSEMLPFLSSTPLQIDFVDNIKSIFSGTFDWSTRSTIFFKNDNYVWVLEDDKGIKNPTQVKDLKDIKNISIGDNIAAVQDSDHVWIWGQNLYGSYHHLIYAPICQKNLTNVKLITAGYIQLFWVNETEALWGWHRIHLSKGNWLRMLIHLNFRLGF